MAYDEIASTRKRREVASTLRRWRQARDKAIKAKSESQSEIERMSNFHTAQFYQNNLNGFREALKILGE